MALKLFLYFTIYRSKLTLLVSFIVCFCLYVTYASPKNIMLMSDVVFLWVLAYNDTYKNESTSVHLSLPLFGSQPSGFLVWSLAIWFGCLLVFVLNLRLFSSQFLQSMLQSLWSHPLEKPFSMNQSVPFYNGCSSKFS